MLIFTPLDTGIILFLILIKASTADMYGEGKLCAGYIYWEEPYWHFPTTKFGLPELSV